jgi:hypothetical protein
MLDLRKTSGGVRESGAFLLKKQSASRPRASTYIRYDILDHAAYQGGAIAFHASGYAALWEHCRREKLELLADIHAHPGRSVQQSPIDQRNPMVPFVGHTALIVPNYAGTPWWSLKEVGVYEYLGGYNWRTYSGATQSAKIKLVLR